MVLIKHMGIESAGADELPQILYDVFEVCQVHSNPLVRILPRRYEREWSHAVAPEIAVQ